MSKLDWFDTWRFFNMLMGVGSSLCVFVVWHIGIQVVGMWYICLTVLMSLGTLVSVCLYDNTYVKFLNTIVKEEEEELLISLDSSTTSPDVKEGIFSYNGKGFSMSELIRQYNNNTK